MEKFILSKILKDTNLDYIKHNRVKLKEGSQKKVTGIFKEFFENINGTVKELKGFAILKNRAWLSWLLLFSNYLFLF